MKKSMIFLAAMCIAATAAWAITVTTSDNVNFNVTNDTGFTTVWTNAQIMAEENYYNSQMAVDNGTLTWAQQHYQADSEAYMLMNEMEQGAIQASATWQANQVNGD